jgi:hypothetical protein
MQTFPESAIFVLPWFNERVRRFVTTYRCRDCWPASLEQAIATLTATEDAAEIASAGEVFRDHAVFIHEYLRGDPPATVKPLLLRTFELLRSEELRLKIGKTAPVTLRRDGGPS